MSRSPWSGAGSAGSATAATTPVGTAAAVTAVADGLSQANSEAYLVNMDKIQLRADWDAEAYTQAQLNTQASAAGVSATAYGNAITALSTALVAAGAPSNWATSWPDGTTFGPSTGIMGSIRNLWASIAQQRTTLQNAIAGSQAAAAQTAAISAAATDATSKSNAVAITVPKTVTGFPTLPDATNYPAGRLIYETGNKRLYRSTGSTWESATTAAGDVTGQLTAGQISGVNAAAISGQIADANLAAIAASKVTGQLTNAQIADLAAAKISGQLTNAQVAALDAAKLTGTLNAAQVAQGSLDSKINALATTKLTGTVGADLIAANSIFTKHLTLANFDNLVPNWNSEMDTSANPTGVEANGIYSGVGHSGSKCRRVIGIGPADDAFVVIVPQFPTIPGQKYLLEWWAMGASSLGSATANCGIQAYMAGADAYSTASGYGYPQQIISSYSWQKFSQVITALGQTLEVRLHAWHMPAGYFMVFDDFFMRLMSDASLIVDGSITATEMAAGTITAASGILADAVIGTAKIQDAAISTAKIANLAVDTAQIKDGAIVNAKITNLDAGKINTGYLAAARIDAGTITGDKVAAGTISAQKLTIANFDNLIPNPNSELANPAAGTIEANGIYNGGYEGSHARLANAGTATYFTDFIPVSSGQQYYLEAMVYGNAAGNAYLVIEAENAAGAGIDWLAYAAKAGTGWTKITVTATIATLSGQMPAFIRALLATDSGQVYADNLYMRRMNDGNVIVDGAITTNKMTANSISGDRIAANTLDASKILADSITAGQIAANAIGAAEIAAGSIFARNLTLANFDNLIPNGNCELDLTNMPAGSVEGNGIAGSAGSKYRIIYGAGTGAGAMTSLRISPDIPMMPGEKYLLTWEQSGNYATGSTTSNCGMEVYMPGTDAWNTAAGYGFPQQLVSTFTWIACSQAFTVPAGAARVMYINIVAWQVPTYSSMVFRNFTLRKQADAKMIVDGAILAQKLDAAAIQTTGYTEDGSGNPTVGAKLQTGGTALKVASSNFQLGPYLFTDYFYRQLQAIDGANGGRVVYRGNVDVSTRGGAPNISCLSVMRRRWDVTLKYTRLELTIQPTGANDNLDALRFAKVQLYRQSAAGTTATLTTVDTFFPALADRRYGNFGTDTDASNASLFTWEATDTLISSGVPAVLVTLYNAYGPSAGNCFYSAAGAGDSVGLTNNGTTWPSGITGASGGGSGGGGGGGGGGCPAPWVEITLASGITVHAADLYDGAQVAGVNDNTMEPAAGIVRSPRTIWVDRVPVILEDGRAPEFSLPHRVAVEGRGWVEVRNLKPGDSLIAQLPSIVKALGRPIKAQVVTFQVEGCATYFSDGILSHNLKSLVE